jgi:hypothetical protein
MLTVIMLNVGILSIIMLNVGMLSVIMLSVMAPKTVCISLYNGIGYYSHTCGTHNFRCASANPFKHIR